MPLDKIESIQKNLHLAIWNIKEREEELNKLAYLSEPDQHLLDELNHPTKRLEFLAGRALTTLVCERLELPFKGIKRNAFGKPVLIDSAYEMSLSHTEEYVVLLISKGINVGIDIEKPKEKMKKVAPRLFNTQELKISDVSLNNTSKIWSAKEVLFKLYMKGGIDFKEHLFIEKVNTDFSYCEGSIQKEGKTVYQLRFMNYNNYIICFNTSGEIK